MLPEEDSVIDELEVEDALELQINVENSEDDEVKEMCDVQREEDMMRRAGNNTAKNRAQSRTRRQGS